MSVPALSDLRAELEALETGLDRGGCANLARIRALERAALHWAKTSPEGHPVPRLARLLMRVGAPDAAADLLETAHALLPRNDPIALLLANAAAEAGRQKRTLEVLTPLANALDASPALLTRVAELNMKFGSIEESLRLHRRAARLDGSRLKGLITTLMAAKRNAEALREAREGLDTGIFDPALSFACYNVIAKLSKDEAEIAEARKHFLSDLPADASGSVWRARLHRSEDDLEAALAELNAALAALPRDAELMKERTAVLLSRGTWGCDAKLFVEAQQVLRDAPELRARVAQVDQLLGAFGGSLERAAQDESFAHVMTPESVFEFVAGDGPQTDAAPRRGLAMIAHSLTAGGAERVVAETFRALHADKRFDWVKLYLIDCSPGADFYLPLIGDAAADIVLLDRNCRIEAPFAWLPQDSALTAQSIFNRLREDRPAIVHASLEPLALFAGLAALRASVPRIVLHTHNMRPTDLRPELTMPRRWRGCYQALLKRKEVSLVGVAEAAIADYRAWLALQGSMHAVHNGFDASRFKPNRDRKARAELRAALGIAEGAPVVGTAFKFRQEKRPLHWVDMACRVIAARPESRFVMFGDGELMEPTRRHIEARGVAANFILPGLVNDLEKRLPALDLFVLSSASEALPNVLLEAQACGVPVIARHVGGIAETLCDGRTGILVAEDTAEALATAILRALSDEAWRQSASAEGERFVRERFKPDAMLAKLSAILLEGA